MQQISCRIKYIYIYIRIEYMLYKRKAPWGISWQFFSIYIFFFFFFADCKQAAPEYKHATLIYTSVIDICALEGKLYAFPQYVRRREHAAEEDLQPRKLYYSGRLGQSCSAVENKDCRNKGFLYLFFFFVSFIIPLLHFRYNTPIYPCIVRLYIWACVLCDPSGSK